MAREKRDKRLMALGLLGMDTRFRVTRILLLEGVRIKRRMAERIIFFTNLKNKNENTHRISLRLFFLSSRRYTSTKTRQGIYEAQWHLCNAALYHTPEPYETR